MRNNCSSDAGEQQHEEKEGEENENSSSVIATGLNASERCPICLNILNLEVGFPEHCCHAFCVSCILKWSETSNSCPVDRKTFQAVYKIDRIGGCTKIQVMEKCPGEDLHCHCDQYLQYCMKCKTNFRMQVTPDSANEDNSELEHKNLEWQKLCYTGDLMATCPFVLPEIEAPYANSAEVEEENEIYLLQRKREGMKHLRFSTAVDNIECDPLSTGTLIHPPIYLEEYIFTRSPFSIRNKDFSKRTCVHSSAQDGTEKKQTASGASNSRGTRKKPVQSSTRRRSTRNSKSDVSQVQSSPKSSGSDQETLGCNTSTKASGKKSSKPRKGPPKKGSRVRKRLRSAAHSQEDSNDSKENSASELEQEEKKSKLSDEDVSETEDRETNLHSPKSAEKGHQQVDDHSPYSSALEHSDDQQVSVSLPMQNIKCVDKEIPASPNLQTNDEFDREDIFSSPVLKNGQPTLGESQTISLSNTCCSTDGNVEMAKEHLGSEEKHSLESRSLHDSEGENSSSSPVPAKHRDSDNTVLSLLPSGRVQQFHDKESACLPASETELTSQNISSALYEEFQDADKHDYSDKSDTRWIRSEQQSNDVSSPLLQEHTPPILEDKSCKANVSTVSLTVNSDEQCDMELSPPYLDSFKEPPSEAQTIDEMQNVKPTVPFGSLKLDQGNDEKANSLDVNLQSDKPKECIEVKAIKLFKPCESKPESIPDNSINTTEYAEQCPNSTNMSVFEGFHNEISSNQLENIKIKSLPEKCKEVDESKLPVAEDDSKTPDIKNEPLKAFCEDNIESVAMDCDSVCSDHNESETEQSTENIVTLKPEVDSLVSTNSEVLQSPPKGLPLSSDSPKKETRTRKSRFHSPSITWSPTKSDVKERQRSRSRSKGRDSPVKSRDRSRGPSRDRSRGRSRGGSHDRSRGRSRDREGDRNHGGQRKGRSRDRRHRRLSRSKSRSGSRSGSSTRHRNRSSTADRSEKDCGSPLWKERRSNENWKSPRGSERYRRNEHEKTNEHFRNEKHDSRDTDEQYTESKNDYPDWVMEKMKSEDSSGRGDGRGRGDRGWGDTRARGDGRGRGENRARGDHRGDLRGRGGDRGRGNRGRGSPRGSWEDNQYSSGDSWNRNVNIDWNSPRGHGGRGRGAFRGGLDYGDQNENNWNNRPSYSGNSNASGQESSRFMEHKNYKPKHEELFEPPADRSGWSSASSWAVRKTLPADVQNYYSKRGRNSTGSQSVWPRPEESQDQDQAPKEQPSQQNESAPLPVNIVPPQMNVVQQPMNAPPQPINMFPYPVGVHPPIVNIQHNPYNLHPPLPIHLHPALPLVQVSAPSSVPQGLPPPPPPPPPSQQVNYIVPQQDGKPVQGNPSASHVSNNLSAPLLPAPTAAQGIVGTVLGPSSGSVVTSSHSKNSFSVKSAARKESITVEASADSFKKEKKIQIQERAAHEVKVAIKQYYQNKEITKDEYKEIVKKAVDKVCHSKSGEVDSAKVANLVKAYVDKYKRNRKKGTDDKL